MASSGGRRAAGGGRRAAGGGRRAAGGGRRAAKKLGTKPRPGKPSDADFEKAVARCLKGEKVSAVARDFPGIKYNALWMRVKAAKNGKVAHQHDAPTLATPATKRGWV
jgi:hypothetical protein